MNSLDQLLNNHKTKINLWLNVGFGPDASADILKEMAQKLKDCGGSYKKALDVSELKQELTLLANTNVLNMK